MQAVLVLSAYAGVSEGGAFPATAVPHLHANLFLLGYFIMATDYYLAESFWLS